MGLAGRDWYRESHHAFLRERIGSVSNRIHRRADVASDKRIRGDVRSGERRDEAIAVARNRRDDI